MKEFILGGIMSIKIRFKGLISLVFMTLSFYMMISTRYSKALGDYVLEFISLKSWTAGDTGTHLTIIYFGILFLIGFYFVIVTVVVGWNKKNRIVFLYSVGLLLIYYFCTASIFTLIKSNSEGLLPIGYENTDNSYIEYRVLNNNKINEFEIYFELKNYSNEKKLFYIQIPNKGLGKNSYELLYIYGIDGKLALFNLNAKETQKLLLTSDSYYIKTDNSGFNTTYSVGHIDSIVLTDLLGNKICLNKENFLGRIIK
jgi:hypothetical protein